MKLEITKSSSTETYVEHGNLSVTLHTWGNMEGANLMVHGENNAMRMAGSFRWEELDAVCLAITAARAT